MECYEGASGFKRLVLFGSILALLTGIFSVLVSAAPVGGGSMVLQYENENLVYTKFLTGHPSVRRVTIWLEKGIPDNTENLINVKILEEKPAGAEEPPLLVNTYLSIESPEQVENAAIEFKVPKSWIEQNRIDEDTIVLLRLENGWEELHARLVDSSDIYLCYEAVSLGLSVFAIAGRPSEIPAHRVLFAVLLTVGIVGGLVAAYWVLTRPVRAFISTRKLRRAVTKRAEKPKLVGKIRAGKLKLPTPAAKKKTIKDIKRLRRLKRKMAGKE